jgi:hypothetical protein
MFLKPKFSRQSYLKVPPQVHHDLDCLHGLSQHPLTFTTKGKTKVGLSATSLNRILTFLSFQHVTLSLSFSSIGLSGLPHCSSINFYFVLALLITRSYSILSFPLLSCILYPSPSVCLFALHHAFPLPIIHSL